MAIGSSGRIVIDIDPNLKRRLHAALQEEAKTLKDWFLERCLAYLEDRGQLRLFGDGASRKHSHRDTERFPR